MSNAIVLLLTVLAQIASSLGSSSISNVITLLENLIPILVKEVQSVVPIVQNIIDALRSNALITPAQLSALEAIEIQYDADFEAAAAAAQAEDAPPATTS